MKGSPRRGAVSVPELWIWAVLVPLDGKPQVAVLPCASAAERDAAHVGGTHAEHCFRPDAHPRALTCGPREPDVVPFHVTGRSRVGGSCGAGLRQGLPSPAWRLPLPSPDDVHSSPEGPQAS